MTYRHKSPPPCRTHPDELGERLSARDPIRADLVYTFGGVLTPRTGHTGVLERNIQEVDTLIGRE
ncbi:hypothetical protein VDGD_21561 [Verticillium dahliae]|nr:hypothetical protein VDGD_21561 [Verticillium dahliae]